MQIALTAITVITVCIALYTDVRYSKIYNYLTMPALGIGVVLNTVFLGLPGLLSSVEGVGIGAALFVFCAVFGRILGGGDIKLLAAVGALQGPHFLLVAMLFTAFAGGLLAIVVALSRGILRQRVQHLVSACTMRAVANAPMDIPITATSGARLPYAIAICLGTVTAIALPYLHLA